MEFRNLQVWLNRIMLQPGIYAEDILELVSQISEDVRREIGMNLGDLPTKSEKDIYLLQKKTDYLVDTLKEKADLSERKIRNLEEKKNELEAKIRGGLGTDTAERIDALQNEVSLLRDVVRDMGDYLGYIPESTEKEYVKYGFVDKLDRIEKELFMIRNRYREVLLKTEDAAKKRYQGESDNERA